MVDKKDSIPLGDRKDHITADVDSEWWVLIIASLMWDRDWETYGKKVL